MLRLLAPKLTATQQLARDYNKHLVSKAGCYYLLNADGSVLRGFDTEEAAEDFIHTYLAAK
jgi:hypothetical protein